MFDFSAQCLAEVQTLIVSAGIENPALELQPTPRAIGIPFTPTVGCRIDFNDVPLDALTPCSMLAKALVFTPDKQAPTGSTPKRLAPTALSVISEESVDIEDQLNCYQLELENSINEAKSNEKKSKHQNLMEVKHKANFAERLRNAQYSELGAEPKVSRPTFAERIKNSRYSELSDDKPAAAAKQTDSQDTLQKPKVIDMIAKCTTSSDVGYEELIGSRNALCEDYDSASENESEFKNPAPFVRTFRRTGTNGFKEPTNPGVSDTKDSRKTSGIRSSIRKSIRKLMSNSHSHAEPSEHKPNENTQSSTVFSTLRQSFRKKVGSKASGEPLLYDSNHDVSILVESDRKVFRQLSPNQKRVNVIGDGAAIATKKSIIRGSFRSTKRYVQRSVFKKNVEDYCLD